MARILFNRGWQFREKVNPFAEMGRASRPYADVELPHDAMIGQPRDPHLHLGAWRAFFPGGTFEYRKTFDIPVGPPHRRTVFDFEGIYRDATIHVNGVFAGQRPYGYARFLVDATDLVHPGESNQIRVEARAHGDGRWYTGAGIYRDVWIHLLDPVHFGIDGIRVTAPDIEPARAVVEIEIEVSNESATLQTVDVASHLADPSGNNVASGSTRVTVLAGESAITRHRLYVGNPQLWSPDSPHLYTFETELFDAGAPLETRKGTFGIRRLQLDPEQGLRINGKTIKLRGACVHHDNGIIGAATIGRADERRVEILKSAGFNAIRSAHNPISVAMLEACDRLGMLVMDEAFDAWTVGKTEFGYQLAFPEWWERDIESMIAKDFNHPSVILYSIGNEIPETGTPLGGVWGRRLSEKVRSLDGTRFVTNAINGMLAVMDDIVAMRQDPNEPVVDDAPGINTLMSDVGGFMNWIGSSEIVTQKTTESFGVLDISGMNYLEDRYETDRQLFPNRLIVGTETFPTQIDKNWNLVLTNSHVLGDFTWTGWDYLGEVGIGRGRYPDQKADTADFHGEYPWLTAWCGDIDITGHRRPASYYREIVFGLRSDPYVSVRCPARSGQSFEAGPWTWSDSTASWSWDGFEGKPVTVEVYSDAPEVELLINDRSIGRRSAGAPHRFRCEFDTVYLAGTITAVAYRDGVAAERTTLTSACGPARLAVNADRTLLRADGTDLAYLAVSVVDEAGNAFVVDRPLTLTVEGPAQLQGFGSGNPVTDESFSQRTHSTFEGRALAAIRPTGTGTVRVGVSAPGCAATTIEILAEPDDPRAEDES